MLVYPRNRLARGIVSCGCRIARVRTSFHREVTAVCRIASARQSGVSIATKRLIILKTNNPYGCCWIRTVLRQCLTMTIAGRSKGDGSWRSRMTIRRWTIVLPLEAAEMVALQLGQAACTPSAIGHFIRKTQWASRSQWLNDSGMSSTMFQSQWDQCEHRNIPCIHQ